MFLFSFPSVLGEGECKQEFRNTKKNTQLKAEKTRAGKFVGVWGGGGGGAVHVHAGEPECLWECACTCM